MRDFDDEARPPLTSARDHQKELVKVVTGLSNRRNQWQVFPDFAEIDALSISNAVDLAQRDKREERYTKMGSARASGD